MKKIFILILMLTNLWSQEINEKRESFQAQIKVDLIKNDNSTVNLLDGTQFIELKSSLDVTDFGSILEGLTVPIGEYKGINVIINAFKHKLYLHHICDNLTTYYTTNRTVAQGEQWLLSTNINDYGYTTTLAPEGGFVLSTTFPKPLKITLDNTSNLIWINEFGGVLNYEFPDGMEDDGNLSHIVWADEPTLLRAFLPDMPTRKLSYTIRYTHPEASVLENRVTYFLNASNELIGAFMSRPQNQALNGSDLILGNNNGNNYSIRFQDGDDSNDGSIGNDYYDVNVTLNCEAPNIEDAVQNINVTVEGIASLPNAPYTLTASNLACDDIIPAP